MILSLSDILNDNRTYRMYTNKKLGLMYLHWSVGSFLFDAAIDIETYELISYSRYLA
jgi:hypothetical protein